MGYVTDIATRTIKKYKTSDPFKIISLKGIMYREYPLADTLGFYMMKSRIQFIMVNSDINEQLKKFVCAHELGHAVLHPRSNTPFLRKNTLFSVEKIEVEANTFAINLLLSDKNLQDYETKFDVLRENGIPFGMERYINWW